MDSSWYITIQKEVINIVVIIVTHMTKPIIRCADTKVYKVVEGIYVGEIVGS
jgi:hypothetical protein